MYVLIVTATYLITAYGCIFYNIYYLFYSLRYQYCVHYVFFMAPFLKEASSGIVPVCVCSSLCPMIDKEIEKD